MVPKLKRCNRGAAKRIATVATLALLGHAAPGQNALPPLAAAAAAPEPVEIQATAPVVANLSSGGRTAKVKLTGTAASRVAYVDAERADSPVRQMPRESIDEAWFEITIDRSQLDQAVQQRRWMDAVNLIVPAVQATLPYLDLPNNNAIELVVEAGDHLMRAAAMDLANAKTPEEEQKALKKYEAAYLLLIKGARATWSSQGTIALVKSVRCLLELDKPKTAAKNLDTIDPPFPGDAAFGIYWLVKAEMLAKAQKYREAMDAAVKSLCFESKDIDTFPDALMLSARCYEEMLEWYRARDVYYEVARIFPRTDWADLAARRLEFIVVEKRLTLDEEKLPIQNVFFGLKEDMNKLAKDYIEAKKKGTEVDSYAEFTRDENRQLEEDLDKADAEARTAPARDPTAGPPDAEPPPESAGAPAKPPAGMKRSLDSITKPVNIKSK